MKRNIEMGFDGWARAIYSIENKIYIKINAPLLPWDVHIFDVRW